MKTKDEPEKQTENKAETKLANLLKIIKTPKKESENKPENKAGQVIENTRQPEIKPKNKPEKPLFRAFCRTPKHVAHSA